MLEVAYEQGLIDEECVREMQAGIHGGGRWTLVAQAQAQGQAWEQVRSLLQAEMQAGAQSDALIREQARLQAQSHLQALAEAHAFAQEWAQEMKWTRKQAQDEAQVLAQVLASEQYWYRSGNRVYTLSQIQDLVQTQVSIEERARL